MAALTPGYVSFGDIDSEKPLTTEIFNSKADIEDGVSGKASLDTTYENTDYELVHDEYNEK